MKVLVQRCDKASVTVNNEIVGKIDKGFMVLLGVTHEDTKENAEFLAPNNIKSVLEKEFGNYQTF